MDFKHALEHLKADPNAKDTITDMTIFEKVLMTPDSADYIKLCIDNGADLYAKNDTHKFPLHYCIDSYCPRNLNTFLKHYDPTEINVKFYNENSLHLLMKNLTNDNYENVAECIKMLLLKGCNPNMPNEKSRTPFFMLLQKQPKLKNSNELVDFFLSNAKIDMYTYKSKDIIRMMQNQNPHQKLSENIEKVINYEYMNSLLGARHANGFESNFKAFKENATSKQDDDNQANNFSEDCARLLETAVVNHVESAIELLLESITDINKRPKNATYEKSPIQQACSRGYYKILQMLLRSPNIEVTCGKTNLLHEVCHHFGLGPCRDSNVDYQKCFELLLNKCDVNQQDELGCTPLHYAARYRNNQAVKGLLEKSSYIGKTNILGETPVNDINRDTFKEFLDECITTNIRRNGDDEHEITIDYKFLMAPAAAKHEEFSEEIAPLREIAKNSDLRPLILHPVLSSFLYLKWSKLTRLFYFNLILFCTFMVSLIVYIVLCQSIPEEQRNNNNTYSFFYLLSIISIIILMVREVFQFFLSPIDYMKSPINWFEIILIVLGWIVLLQDNKLDDATQRILRAVTILFAAYELLQLVGNLPFLSVSTHMVILKKVALTFFKSIALYSILLLAFALSFYTLFGGRSEKSEENENSLNETSNAGGCKQDNDGDEFNNFGYPGIAIIKTFVMLTGEFDASALDLDRNGAFYCIIFLLFVFLVRIIEEYFLAFLNIFF